MAKKILLVDDEPQLVDMVKMRLEAAGYTVATAFDGEDGLKKAVAMLPDLIILDILMPGIDGFEALARLRGNADTRYIPVIMLTAKKEAISLFKAQELGVTEYIAKPFDSEELLDLVKQLT